MKKVLILVCIPFLMSGCTMYKNSFNGSSYESQKSSGSSCNYSQEKPNQQNIGNCKTK